ncbi:DUF4982 domain-containing protein, partial [Draconibacterium sp.]|nr:DUF4982 domain-containing protein [Draconibacterium sp.]
FNSTRIKRYANVESSPWIDVIENDENMGLFLWPGIAYLGERRSWGGIGSIGLFNFAGFRETDSYLYEAFWSDKPMVHLEVYVNPTNDLSKMSQWGQPATHQNWNLPKGSKVNVITYTNCETVDLYLNNKKITTQKLADFPNWLMKWNDITYQRGKLKAVGKINGKAVCESSIVTSGKLHQINIKADKQKVKEGDIVHVELSLQDKKGRPINNVEKELNFEIDGDAAVIALENGDSNDMTPFTNKKSRLTHEGKCLCIIKVGSNIDKEISLTVKSEGIKDHRLLFETKN